MLPALSIERRILQRMQELDLTADHLAALDGNVSPSRLSAAFRGVKNLDTPLADRLVGLLADLAELQKLFAPAPLHWRHVAAIRMLLAAKRADRLDVKID